MLSQSSQSRPDPTPQAVYRNSIPVVVLLVPVEDKSGCTGLLTVIRGIEPGRGSTALPGGYVEEEIWQQAALRELVEETGISLSSLDKIHLESLESVQQGKKHLIFCRTDAIPLRQINMKFQNEETLGLRIIYEPEKMAFPAHTDAVERFFRTQNRGREADEDLPDLSKEVFNGAEKRSIGELAGAVSAALERRYGGGDWQSVERRETIGGCRIRYNWSREGSNWGWSDYSSYSISDRRSTVTYDNPDLRPVKLRFSGADPEGMLINLLERLEEKKEEQQQTPDM